MKRLAALAFALLTPILASAQYNSYMRYALGTAPSYEGLWWNSAESGWGLSIAHQGDMIFAVWYTFDESGAPTWFVMPEGALVPDEMDGMNGMGDMEMMMGMSRNPPLFSGKLYRPSKRGGKLVMTEVGMGTVLFREREKAIFAYTVGNVSSSRAVTKMMYGAASQTCTVGGAKGAAENYQDLWFNPSDTGWGVNIAHQGDTIFATYFTYDSEGKNTWLVVPDATRSASGAYTGTLARATGPSFAGEWDASQVHVTAVGTGSFTFDSLGHGHFNDLDMSRMQFAAPATVCR